MSQSNIFNVSDLVQFYHDQDLGGEIKVFFRKSDIKAHNSKLDKAFFVVKPLVVKVGDIFDDEVKFSIFIKPKHNYRINLIDHDMWVMIIDDEQRTFKNDDGKDISFYDVSLKYITNKKLVGMILEKYLNNHNIEQYINDEL